MLGFYSKLNEEILPLYYDERAKWDKIVMQSLNDIVPYFDSDRMVTEYYEVMYA
jgi:starch phosphorylase